MFEPDNNNVTLDITNGTAQLVISWKIYLRIFKIEKHEYFIKVYEVIF